MNVYSGLRTYSDCKFKFYSVSDYKHRFYRNHVHYLCSVGNNNNEYQGENRQCLNYYWLK